MSSLRRPSLNTAALAGFVIVLSSCAHTPAVNVLSEASADCEFLGAVGNGIFWESGEQALDKLRQDVAVLGGNHLVCCEISDALVLYRFEGRQHAGEAYRCPSAAVPAADQASRSKSE